MKKKIWPGDIWEVLVPEHHLINPSKYARGIGQVAEQKLRSGDRFVIVSTDDEYRCLISLWGIEYGLSKSDFTRHNFKRIWCASPPDPPPLPPPILLSAYRPVE